MTRVLLLLHLLGSIVLSAQQRQSFIHEHFWPASAAKKVGFTGNRMERDPDNVLLRRQSCRFYNFQYGGDHQKNEIVLSYGFIEENLRGSARLELLNWMPN